MSSTSQKNKALLASSALLIVRVNLTPRVECHPAGSVVTGGTSVTKIGDTNRTEKYGVRAQ